MFYHTIYKILVNGNRVDIFENELFKPICEAIKTSCSRLSVVNEQSDQFLSSNEKLEANGKHRAIEKGVECTTNPDGLSVKHLQHVDSENSQDIYSSADR